MDERQIYEQYNLSLAACSLENETSVASVVKAFVCPSNPRRGKFVHDYYLGSEATGGVGPTDYVFSIGGFGRPTTDNPFVTYMSLGLHLPPGNMRMSFGAFEVNSSVRMDAIGDGVSNTFLMGESVGGLPLAFAPDGKRLHRIHADEPIKEFDEAVTIDQAWSQGHVPGGTGGGYGSVFGATAWNAWYNRDRTLTDPALWIPIRPNEGRLQAGRPTWTASSGRDVGTLGTILFDEKGSSTGGPLLIIGTLDGRDGTALPADEGSTQGFRGFHVDGVPFLMADGSVRFVNDSIDLRLYVGLSTVAGREEIPKDWQ
jgi:hypothetical protein